MDKSEPPRPISDTEEQKVVLVVDDNRPIRSLVKDILLSNGYQVLEAEDGQRALTICQQPHLHIDLLLTDIIMPGMDGYELAHHVSQLRKDCKIMFMTGHTERTASFPGAILVRKPFTAQDLIAEVNKIFCR